jgi:hypothetical protein
MFDETIFQVHQDLERIGRRILGAEQDEPTAVLKPANDGDVIHPGDDHRTVEVEEVFLRL